MKINKFPYLKYFLLYTIILFCLNVNFNENCLADENFTSYYYVDINGDGNFTNIQDAIDYAKSGDIIFVNVGLYFENIVIDKKISLIGIDKNNTIIDGRGAGNVIKINSDSVEIKNCSIQNSGSYFPNSGINCSSNNNIILNNIIKNCFYGITLYNSNNNIINLNVINEEKNCGIYITNSSNNSFFNNSIFNNTYNGIGIYSNSDYNTIKNNSFYNNGYCGINIRDSSKNYIILNNFSNNNIGIHIPKLENFINDNYFVNNNDDIDEEISTPGFEILTFIFIFALIMFLFKFKRFKVKK